MSLWCVLDDATESLMLDFYRRLLDGAPPADTLRAAQRSLKDAGEAPLGWGAFNCQDDPGPLPRRPSLLACDISLPTRGMQTDRPAIKRILVCPGVWMIPTRSLGRGCCWRRSPSNLGRRAPLFSEFPVTKPA